MNHYMPLTSEHSKPTIQDVAATLGMAKSTVSKGLTGKGTLSAATRERIQKAAREMGYEPDPIAQRLANKGDNNLVYLCSCNLDLGQTTEKILAIQKKLNGLDLEVPIYSVAKADGRTQRPQAEEIRNLCRQQPRAIVFCAQGCPPSVFPELQRYQEKGGILVCYDWPVPLACDQVVFHRDESTYQVASYLLERGHRKIGINLPDATPTMDKWANPRLEGFTRAIKEAGLDMDDQWVFFGAGPYEQGGAHLAQRFLELKDRPTGLCIVNDYVALAFMAEVMAAGVKIPQDLSVVSHDNELVARYCPVPLTSANHPVEAIVQTVVDLLVERLNGNHAEARTITLGSEIVERQSVATLAN